MKQTTDMLLTVSTARTQRLIFSAKRNLPTLGLSDGVERQGMCLLSPRLKGCHWRMKKGIERVIRWLGPVGTR